MKTLVVLVVIIVTKIVYGNVDNASRVTKVVCFTPPDNIAITNVSCWAKPINRTVSVGNIRFFVLEPFNDVTIHLQLFKQTDVTFRPFILNLIEDYCAFFTKKNHRGSAYLKFLYQMYGPYSNLNHSCPYLGEIMIKDVPADARFLPSLWPSGLYRLDVTIYNLNVYKFKFQVFLDVTEK